LLQLVKTSGENWSKISEHFKETFITPKILKDRFRKKFNPSLKRTKFSPEEDEIIIKIYQEQGPK
jgi:hypothetical protein